MKRLKNIIWDFLNVIGIAGIIQLAWKGKYLSEKGWLKSFRTKQSIDKNGNPLPWCTYSYIQFIEPRLTNAMDVFEFGCGNSTLWFARKVRSVRSVDHDKHWVEKISPQLPHNASIVYKELNEGGEYSNEVRSQKKNYHIIVIDGRDRNNCVLNSMNSLTSDGVIVFDNSQLPEYSSSLNYLTEQGFRRLDFYGLLPIVPTENCTTIFYRSNNCLNI